MQNVAPLCSLLYVTFGLVVVRRPVVDLNPSVAPRVDRAQDVGGEGTVAAGRPSSVPAVASPAARSLCRRRRVLALLPRSCCEAHGGGGERAVLRVRSPLPGGVSVTPCLLPRCSS